jgi:hypothetical protein
VEGDILVAASRRLERCQRLKTLKKEISFERRDIVYFVPSSSSWDDVSGGLRKCELLLDSGREKTRILYLIKMRVLPLKLWIHPML